MVGHGDYTYHDPKYNYTGYENNGELSDYDCPKDMARQLAIVTKVPGVLYCEQTYDTLLCFPSSPAGQYATVSCPAEIKGVPLNPLGTVYKYCFPNGTWNKAIYEPCLSDIHDLKNKTQEQQYGEHVQEVDHMLYISIIHHTGTVVSLIAVLVALGIFYYCRGLRTLLQSIRTRLLLCLLIKDMMWILLTVSLPKLQSMAADNTEDKAYPWTCQLIKFAFNYLTVAFYFWLLCEGVYFFIMMVWDLSCVQGKFWKYAIIGWGGPFIPVFTWAILQASTNNIGCILVAHVHDYIYIAPIFMVLILIIIFLMCTSYFLTNVPMTTLEDDTAGYLQFKKTIRATLVVFPTLSLGYVIQIIAIILQPKTENDGDNVVYVCFMYMSAIVESLQGLFISFVYCFVNKQVWHAVKNRPKEWRSKKSNMK